MACRVSADWTPLSALLRQYQSIEVSPPTFSGHVDSGPKNNARAAVTKTNVIEESVGIIRYLDWSCRGPSNIEPHCLSSSVILITRMPVVHRQRRNA